MIHHRGGPSAPLHHLPQKGLFTMTNATIILNESFRLMEEGKLHGSGQFAEIETENGPQTVCMKQCELGKSGKVQGWHFEPCLSCERNPYNQGEKTARRKKGN